MDKTKNVQKKCEFDIPTSSQLVRVCTNYNCSNHGRFLYINTHLQSESHFTSNTKSRSSNLKTTPPKI